MNGKTKIKQNRSEEFPFSEASLGDGHYLRKFSKATSSDELIWHKDREDRIIEVISGSNWMLQLDNSIPELLSPGSKYFIKNNTWHRVIRGSSDLIIKLTKLPNTEGQYEL